MVSEDKQLLINEVVSGIVNSKVIPFVGAGLSKTFGLKNWQSLIDSLREEFQTSTTNFLDVAQEYEDRFGRNNLIEKLKQYYTVDDITKYDTSLHELIIAMNPPYIYTTNYDEALELIAENVKKTYTKIACIKHMLNAEHGAKLIVKFHGDFSAPEEIVITEKDYNKRLAFENPLDIQFRSHLLGKSLLFIGYSLRDINIKKILTKHIVQYGAENVRVSYLITYDKYVTNEITKNLESNNIKILSIADNNELVELIKNFNKTVFHDSYRKETKSFFSSKPSEVLLRSDLSNLIDSYNEGISDKDLSEVIYHKIQNRKIPSNLEEDLVKFFTQIIYQKDFIKSKEAIINTFRWLGLSNEYYIKLAIELMELTSFKELNWGDDGSNFTDVISTIEMTLKREISVFLIYLYLFKCYEDKKILTFEHLDRIFYFLKHYRYNEFYDAWSEFPKENQISLIEHFLKQHPPVLRNRFDSSFVGKQLTGSEMTEQILKMIPKQYRNG